MSMYTLYGANGSGSASAEIALLRCGAPFRIVEAAPWDPGPGFDELATVNPLKQIPSLRLPDGAVLSESAAILVYLGLRYPDAELLPNDATLLAQSIRGLVFIAANCYAAISVIDYPERWTTDTAKAAREHVRDAARKRLHANWQIFADQFAAYPFLGGDLPGALDYLAAVVSKWSGARAFLKANRPEFFATLERIERHPSVAPVFARHWPAR
jgi:GST-like protein